MKEHRNINEGEARSRYLGNLPIGCKLCYQGAKAVIFLTGVCYEKCYYCPISLERKNKDKIYVNEREISNINELFIEISEMKALGASITGGEPLLYPQRVLDLISTLKRVFGEDFHIHLYTIGKYVSKDLLIKLDQIGLDEIRFHVKDLKIFEKIKYAVENTNMDVGIEVPIIPGMKNFYFKIIDMAERVNVKFINFNELEMTESNYNELARRGFRLKKDSMVAVENSEEEALEILNWACYNTEKISIHYCSVLYKDYVQTRRRLLRKAFEIAKPYEKVSREGTLIKGVIEVYGVKSIELENILNNKIMLDLEEEDRIKIHVHPKIIQNVIMRLRLNNVVFKAYIVERLPVFGKSVYNVTPISI